MPREVRTIMVDATPKVVLTSKDDIDLVTGMTRYSGVPVSLHPT